MLVVWQMVVPIERALTIDYKRTGIKNYEKRNRRRLEDRS